MAKAKRKKVEPIQITEPTPEHIDGELGVVSRDPDPPLAPSPERRHMSRMISAVSEAVAVVRVGTACKPE